MRITATTGATYRIQFVHSPHNMKSLHIGMPGGLRQFVDNLALSLRRRVTLCEIALASNPHVDEQGRLVHDYMPIAQGFAICHYYDQFVKAIGRQKAFLRAVKHSSLSKQAREELTTAMGYGENSPAGDESDLF